MAKESKAQKATVERVMKEFKDGDLEQGRTGRKVRDRSQAIAIALSEAGASDGRAADGEGRKSAKPRTRSKTAGAKPARPAAKGGSGGEPTKAALYAEAKKRDIAGRSRMTKPELERALSA